MRSLFAAFEFLSILPLRGGAIPPGKAALWFPLVGASIGYLAASVLIASSWILPKPIPALLAVAFCIWITGGLHEDGLADVADAFRPARSPDRVLAILKDSRLGTFGVLAIALSLLLRWQAIAALPDHPILELAASLGLARGAMVVLAYCSRPAAHGLGARLATSLSMPTLLGVALQMIVLAALAGPLWGGLLLSLDLLLIWLAQDEAYRHLGAVNGDVLGALSQRVEIVNLLVFVWHASH